MGSVNDVFQALWGAIIRGELAPHSCLPSSSELAARFGVPASEVNATLQRLEELELVRLQANGRFSVRTSKVRSIARPLRLRVPTSLPDSDADAAAIESHALSALPLLALAERRITAVELEQLDRCVDGMPESQTLYEALSFIVHFWALVARATQNPLCEQRVLHWGQRMRALHVPRGASCKAGVVRKSAYRGLVHALRQRSGATRFWLNVVEPLLT
jgi:DNA-binding FadR family transcriptional regulator